MKFPVKSLGPRSTVVETRFVGDAEATTAALAVLALPEVAAPLPHAAMSAAPSTSESAEVFGLTALPPQQC
ncbi:MAG: hypothetical protein HY071_02915 [Chloroflexi bacterium]|nr:hypothetical protein [Chloroflexota bacterium]